MSGSRPHDVDPDRYHTGLEQWWDEGELRERLGMEQEEDVLIDPRGGRQEQPLELPGAGGALPAPEGMGVDDSEGDTEVPNPTTP